MVWDSPLSFDAGEGYSDRAFDRAARAWVAEQVRKGLVETGALSVRPFSGCPHWALSCAVLGLPFGDGIEGLSLSSSPADEPAPGKGVVIEVHPAVALAALWLDRRIAAPFPRYKGPKAEPGMPAEIARRLEFPSQAGKDDDALDACTAFRLGEQLRDGGARVLGGLTGGGYLMPVGPSADEIQRVYEAHQVKIRSQKR